MPAAPQPWKGRKEHELEAVVFDFSRVTLLCLSKICTNASKLEIIS